MNRTKIIIIILVSLVMTFFSVQIRAESLYQDKTFFSDRQGYGENFGATKEFWLKSRLNLLIFKIQVIGPPLDSPKPQAPKLLLEKIMSHPYVKFYKDKGMRVFPVSVIREGDEIHVTAKVEKPGGARLGMGLTGNLAPQRPAESAK